jgi:ubiquinone/menaquinone biosynthesis C-methylase UbiE
MQPKDKQMDVAQVTAQLHDWQGHSGHAWVEAQQILDRLFQPIEDRLVEIVFAGTGSSVLDVGCGTGSTLLSAARLVRSKGHCAGIDISEAMIAAARCRASAEDLWVDFICGDAQDHGFIPGSFDIIISRFGVMFFDAPEQAFANLRSALRPGGELRCIAWRGPEENPFMTTAERAARSLLANIPRRLPDAPGQFAFAERSRIAQILRDSGWSEIDIRPADFICIMPESELVPYFTKLGPVGLALSKADETTRSWVAETVRPAFDPYVDGSDVRFTAACWEIRARSSLP